MRNRIVLLAVVIGLLVGVAGVGLLVVTDDDGTSLAADLPKLPVGVLGELSTRAAAADSMLAGPVEWRVQGDLPKLDDHATAYRLDAPTDAAVRRLTTALPDARLAGPRGEWTLAPTGVGCSPPPPGAAPDTPVSCASGTVSTAAPCPPEAICEIPRPQAPPADLPSEEDARAIALRTLDAAGFDTSGHVEVFGPGDAWEVMANPKVHGRRVFGAANHLSVGPKGVILRGGGQLLAADAIGDYPLVSTEKGVERLKAQGNGGGFPARGGPEPAIAIDSDAPIQQQPVVRTITGVTLGLQPTFGTTEGYLAPIFLFETDDGGVVPVPAVIDELLEQPGGGGQPEPEPLPEPGPPGQIEPAPPSDGGSTGSSQSCVGAASGSSAGGDPNQPLALEVCASPINPKPGETVTFHLKASDPDAAIDADGCQQPRAAYGDEQDGAVSCLALCQKDNPSPESTTLSRTFTHAYAKPGTYTAVFTADSCAPKSSHGEVKLQINVRG
jgi:hypothetical protein